jgi:hypothetical protein
MLYAILTLRDASTPAGTSTTHIDGWLLLHHSRRWMLSTLSTSPARLAARRLVSVLMVGSVPDGRCVRWLWWLPALIINDVNGCLPFGQFSGCIPSN